MIMASDRSVQRGSSWTGMAFLVESMLLLVFLIGALALFASLFAFSVQRGDESRELTAAVAMASDTAERFCADPTSVPQSFVKDGLTVTCEVANDKRAGGMYRRALITVYDTAGQQVYSLDTAVYESGASR
jgi:Tfp pilus assembly protein PilV